MWAIFHRDIQMAFSLKSTLFTGVVFFAAIIIVTPFALGKEQQILSLVGQGIIWFSALLSSLLSIEKLFQTDQEDGSLDQFMLLKSRHSFSLIIFIKCLSHWCTTILPLIIITPFLGLMLNLNMTHIFSLMLSLLCGTPALTFIGAMGASLTTSLNRGGVLLSIIVLPLTIPIIIFGVASSLETEIYLNTPLTLLIALSLFFSIMAPFSAALALKNLSD